MLVEAGWQAARRLVRSFSRTHFDSGAALARSAQSARRRGLLLFVAGGARNIQTARGLAGGPTDPGLCQPMGSAATRAAEDRKAELRASVPASQLIGATPTETRKGAAATHAPTVSRLRFSMPALVSHQPAVPRLTEAPSLAVA